MINEITESISMKLGNTFSDTYSIYTESAQGMNSPCFVVNIQKPEMVQVLGKRYLNRNRYKIVFIPDEGEKNKKMGEVSQILHRCLKYISVSGSLIEGTSMAAEIKNNVLEFYVNYNVFVYMEEEKETMEKLTVNREGGKF